MCAARACGGIACSTYGMTYSAHTTTSTVVRLWEPFVCVETLYASRQRSDNAHRNFLRITVCRMTDESTRIECVYFDTCTAAGTPQRTGTGGVGWRRCALWRPPGRRAHWADALTGTGPQGTRARPVSAEQTSTPRRTPLRPSAVSAERCPRTANRHVPPMHAACAIIVQPGLKLITPEITHARDRAYTTSCLHLLWPRLIKSRRHL